MLCTEFSSISLCLARQFFRTVFFLSRLSKAAKHLNTKMGSCVAWNSDYHCIKNNKRKNEIVAFEIRKKLRKSECEEESDFWVSNNFSRFTFTFDWIQFSICTRMCVCVCFDLNFMDRKNKTQIDIPLQNVSSLDFSMQTTTRNVHFYRKNIWLWSFI